MNITEIIIGNRALVQTSEFAREVAQIKGINRENGHVIIRLSDGNMSEIAPQYVLKMF